VNDAFKSVSENYLRRLRSNGLLGPNEAAELHHWNFNKTDFPLQIGDSRNLYLIKGTQAEVDALHKSIHQATSANRHIWKGPIHPDHVIPLEPQTPYTPPR
jgi:filamentous hemagglutinin